MASCDVAPKCKYFLACTDNFSLTSSNKGMTGIPFCSVPSAKASGGIFNSLNRLRISSLAFFGIISRYDCSFANAISNWNIFRINSSSETILTISSSDKYFEKIADLGFITKIRIRKIQFPYHPAYKYQNDIVLDGLHALFERSMFLFFQW